MDMKNILAALDGVGKRPAQGSADMKRFVSIIKENSQPQASFTPKVGDEILWRPRNAKMLPTPVTVLAVGADKLEIKLQSPRMIQSRGGKDTMTIDLAASEIMLKPPESAAVEDAVNEEEHDYYRDYKAGTISYDEYQSLLQQERDRQQSLKDRDRGPWYLKIDGKIYSQKGEPKKFDWRSGANNYALAILKKRPELQGKIFLTKKLDDSVAEDRASAESIQQEIEELRQKIKEVGEQIAPGSNHPQAIDARRRAVKPLVKKKRQLEQQLASLGEASVEEGAAEELTDIEQHPAADDPRIKKAIADKRREISAEESIGSDLSFRDYFNLTEAKKKDEVGQSCWKGYRKVGTKPGTGKNAGKRVNDCEKIGESVINEADGAAWIRAFKKIDSGAEPSSDIEWAVKLKLDGVAATINSDDWWKQLSRYGFDVSNKLSKDIVRGQNIFRLTKNGPSIEDIEKMSSDREQQATQQAQSQELSALQHQLSLDQLINKHDLDKSDADALQSMDIEARQAIRERIQEMELQAKERLAKLEIDIRNSKEPEAERQQALTMAQMNHKHEIEVIKVTAEGEYKKAKLEADYQIKIKELELIDNQQERQNRLDVINAEKAKQISVINAETDAKIKEMQAEVDAEQQRSDIRVREEFMQEFKPIWASLIQKASETGKTLSQNISAVLGALTRLGGGGKPAAAKESISYYKDLIDRMESRSR
jgi:hypothetical protein